MTGNSHLNGNTGNPGKQSPVPKTRVLKEREKIARELQDKFFGGNYEVDVSELADYVIEKKFEEYANNVNMGIALGRKDVLKMMQDIVGHDEGVSSMLISDIGWKYAAIQAVQEGENGKS